MTVAEAIKFLESRDYVVTPLDKVRRLIYARTIAYLDLATIRGELVDYENYLKKYSVDMMAAELLNSGAVTWTTHDIPSRGVKVLEAETRVIVP